MHASRFVAPCFVLVLAAAFAPSAAAVDALGGYRSTNDSSLNFGMPEESARPGETFFDKGVRAISREDYRHAIEMYRVAASWAYKPAEYNLGVMYFNGEGVPVDRALGMAWLALAAEREDASYTAARDTAYSRMSPEEFAHANELWRDLRGTYGDEKALRRARARWIQVRNEQTGSHLGHATGQLTLGGRNSSAVNLNTSGGASGKGASRPALTASQSAFGITGPGSKDGSIAYRQLLESDNPYDAKFKQQTGSATVQDIIPIGDATKDQGAKPGTPRFY